MKKIIFFFSLVLFIPILVFGQNPTTIQGKITDENGIALPGANIIIKSLRFGTASDANGLYKFVVPGDVSNNQTVELSANFVGYKEQTVKIILNGKTVEQDFSLETDVFQSSEIVVTGIAGKTSKARSEIAVARIDAKGFTDNNDYQTMSQLLAGKVSGVQVRSTSGNVGTGFRFYMRAGGGINGNEQPIIYIDGVRVDNSETGAFGVGGQRNSALASLSPDAIEKIEVLKGPAAAAMYGTSGSNGVVLITTKAGRTVVGGKGIAVTYRYNYGFNEQSFDYSTNTYKSAKDANANFIKGYIRDHNVTVSGGNNFVKYFGGFSSRFEGGIMPNNDLQRKSVNLSLTSFPSKELVIKFNGTFNYTDINRPQNDNNIFGFLGNTLLFSRSYRFLDSTSIRGLTTLSRKNQFIGSIDVTYNPIENLEIHGTAGVDNSNIREDQTYPSNLYYPFVTNGERDLNNRLNKQFTYSLYGQYNFNITNDLSVTSIVGTQFFNRQVSSSFLGVQNFATELITDIGAGSDVQFYGESFLNSREAGIYTTHSFNYQDRYFLTLGIRRDYASAIGTESPSIYYPKASFAVRLDKLDFVPKFFNLLKLRTAYGESGQLPRLTDPIPLLWSSTVGGYGPGAIINAIGNSKIKPERIKEFEIGVDAEFLDIFSLEFTYYKQNANNSIVGLNNPPSTGLTATSVPFNIGSMKASGFESSLQANLFRNSNYEVNLGLIWNYQTNEVTDLGGAQPIFDGFSNNVIKEGLPKHEFYRQVVKGALFDPTTGVYLGPDVSSERFALGNPIPKHTGSLNINIKLFKRINVYALFDWALDRTINNSTARFAARFGNYEPLNKLNDLLSSQTPGTPEYIATANKVAKLDGNYPSNYFENGKFFKFRELSVSFSFKDILTTYLNSNYISDFVVGLSARNLFTSTPYTGSDVELNSNGGRSLTRGWDFLTLQNPRTYNFWVRLAF